MIFYLDFLKAGLVLVCIIPSIVSLIGFQVCTSQYASGNLYAFINRRKIYMCASCTVPISKLKIGNLLANMKISQNLRW